MGVPDRRRHGLKSDFVSDRRKAARGRRGRARGFRVWLVTGVALRSLLFAALALVAATLFVIDYSQPRQRILPVSVGLAVTAVGTTFLLLRSGNMRIARLRRLAESLPGGALRDRPAGEKTLDLLERSLAGVAIEVHKLLDQMNFESARRDAILSGMTEGVLAVDHELRVTFCNPAFLKAIGFRGTKFEGLSLLELARDPELLDLLREVLSAGEPRQLHFNSWLRTHAPLMCMPLRW